MSANSKATVYMMGKRTIALVGILGLAAVSLAPAKAHADECGSGPRYNNAPTGALILTRNDGVVAEILANFGEYYTHSAVSSSSSSYDWVMHSTLDGIDTCGNDLCASDLTNDANPGPSLLYAGAFQDDQGNVVAQKYGGANSAIRNFMFNCNTNGMSRVYKGNGLYECRQSGNDLNYRLEEYSKTDANVGGLRDGGPSGSQGLVCSTYIAYANRLARGNTMSEKPYTGLCTVVRNVHSAIEDKCHDELSWFEDIFVSCDDVADQVTNCFLKTNKCNNDDNSYKDICNFTGYSISPDRLAGVGSNDGGGPYQNVPLYNLTWSGSEIYGCWEK